MQTLVTIFLKKNGIMIPSMQVVKKLDMDISMKVTSLNTSEMCIMMRKTIPGSM